MLITILSINGALLAALSEQIPECPPGQQMSWKAGEPQRTPGATEGWWQLAVDIGVVAAPVSVVCNLIASWICETWKHVHASEIQNKPAASLHEVKLVLRDGECFAEVQVTSADEAVAQTAIREAMKHVYPEQ